MDEDNPRMRLSIPAGRGYVTVNQNPRSAQQARCMCVTYFFPIDHVVMSKLFISVPFGVFNER